MWRWWRSVPPYRTHHEWAGFDGWFLSKESKQARQKNTDTNVHLPFGMCRPFLWLICQAVMRVATAPDEDGRTFWLEHGLEIGLVVDGAGQGRLVGPNRLWHFVRLYWRRFDQLHLIVLLFARFLWLCWKNMIERSVTMSPRHLPTLSTNVRSRRSWSLFGVSDRLIGIINPFVINPRIGNLAVLNRVASLLYFIIFFVYVLRCSKQKLLNS